MREIKFRAWDGESMYQSPGSNELHHLGSWFEAHSAFVKGNDSIILEYTGLKDKNGKEIYEGDIIKRKIGLIEPDAYHVSFVVWYGQEWRTSNEIPCIQCNCNHATPTKRNIKDFTQCEIIGNIYQNPELINA